MLHEILKIVESGRWLGADSPIVGHIRYHHPNICVITGPNVSGKSMMRKIIHTRYSDRKIEFIHLSQSGRCESGIMKSMIYGTEREDSTGCNSAKTLLTAIKSGINRQTPFALFFDEPEIGCSEELAAGMTIRLINDFDKMKNLVGLFIVSHSKQVLKRFAELNPTHIHLEKEYRTLESWVNREIVPTEDLEGLKSEAHKKWSDIEKMARK